MILSLFKQFGIFSNLDKKIRFAYS
jgi:hypothetical protein